MLKQFSFLLSFGLLGEGGEYRCGGTFTLPEFFFDHISRQPFDGYLMFRLFNDSFARLPQLLHFRFEGFAFIQNAAKCFIFVISRIICT